MGLHGISMTSIILILVVALLLFGTKRLRNMGSDLGAALKSFRKGMNETDNKTDNKTDDQ